MRVTLPLSIPGILAASSLCFGYGVSAFIIPEFLGMGMQPVMSNTIWSRYSISLNYPGGATLAFVLLLLALAISYGLNAVLGARVRGGS
jgi:putative spermidine/putrescine transport system permease protein